MSEHTRIERRDKERKQRNGESVYARHTHTERSVSDGDESIQMRGRKRDRHNESDPRAREEEKR